MWGPWGRGLEGRHLLGQTIPGRVTPWILAVSALESGPNGRTGYGATRETPAGASGGALPHVAGGRVGGAQPDFSKHWDSLMPSWESPEHVAPGQEPWPGGQDSQTKAGVSTHNFRSLAHSRALLGLGFCICQRWQTPLSRPYPPSPLPAQSCPRVLVGSGVGVGSVN